MKPLENVWSSLVQRRLLPVAILLLAALAAIPFVLAKDPEPTAPQPAVPSAEKAGATADAATAEPVVSLVADGERAQRRRVLGVRKNPFEPAKAPKVKAAATPEAGSAPPTQTVTGGTDAMPDSGSGGGSPVTVDGGQPTVGTPVAPAPVAAPKPKYELYSLTVRFGDSEAESLDKLNLPRLKALPSAEDPILVYLGPGKGAKTAIFMVDDTVEAQGDAVCKPSPQNCETLHMRVGDTEFLDVIGEEGNVEAQYQLDLLKIKTSTTADAAKAAKVRAKESKAGRRVLRARQAAAGPLRYRYDAKSGTVRKLDKRAYKAALAKTARIAMGVAGGF